MHGVFSFEVYAKMEEPGMYVSLQNELLVFKERLRVYKLALSACSQAIWVEMGGFVEVLCSQRPSRRLKPLSLVRALLLVTRVVGENACEYFELLH